MKTFMVGVLNVLGAHGSAAQDAGLTQTGFVRGRLSACLVLKR